MRRPERVILIAFVCIIAALLRGGYVAQTYVKDPLRTDAGQYAQYAHNLVEHGTYSLDTSNPPRPDSFRSPGYPLFLAGMRLGFGQHWMRATLWAQVLLGVLAVLLTYALARQRLGVPPSLVAASMVALSPHLVTAGGYVLTECLASVLLLGAVLAMARSRHVTAGLLLGASYLVNEAFLLLPLALLPAIRSWRGTLLTLGAFTLVASPWMVRNQLVIDDPELSGSRRALITLTHGTYPDWVYKSPKLRYSAYLEDPAQPEFGQSFDRFFEVLGARFAEQPGRYLSWYLLEKPAWLWSWSILQGQGDVYVFPVADSLYETQIAAETTRWTMQRLHDPIVIVAGLGLLLALRRGPRRARWVWLVAAAPVYATALYAVFAPWPRYGVPLRPELYLVATWTAVEAIAWLRHRRTRGAGDRADQLATAT